MKRSSPFLPALALGVLVLGGLVLAQGSSGYATIKLKVPENAVVKVGDYTSTQKGPVRTLYTPDLVPGYTYYYVLEITWNEGGKETKINREVKFQANKTVDLDLTKSTSQIGEKKKEEPKKIDTKKEEPKNVEPKKIEPKKVDTKKEQPKKVDTKKEEPKKVDTKKEEKKTEGKKTEPKKEDTKKEDPRVLGKTRTFLFTYGGVVKDLKPGQEADVWLPVASNTAEQEAEIVAKKLPANGTFAQEKEYGNKALHFKAKANKKGEIPFEVVYQITRREVKTDVKAGATLQPRPTDKVSRFLEADKLVPTSGKPLELIKNKKLPKDDQFAAAKMLYDVVNNHMKYSKDGKGWGFGDAVWACDSKFGNCTDFHSLFISMARGNKIPSKFEMGFPVPPKRGAGTIAGYHCWAWFMPQGKGWVPVDISEANRFPDMKNYYFGNLTEDRVQFSTGRDITLEPRQKAATLNYFIYPYVEVGGQALPQDRITRTFSYQDVQ